jgi:hypothetical protein
MKTLILAMAILLGASAAKADTCLSFTADPNSYTAAPGGAWVVYTTFTNCGTEGYANIGSGFGSDESVYATEDFFDPAFFLAPGASTNVAFGLYAWTPDAPDGFTWTPRIDAFYGFVDAPCNGISIPCVYVGQPGTAWANFTAQVEPVPVPEPSSLILLGTGLLALARRLKRRTRGASGVIARTAT